MMIVTVIVMERVMVIVMVKGVYRNITVLF